MASSILPCFAWSSSETLSQLEHSRLICATAMYIFLATLSIHCCDSFFFFWLINFYWRLITLQYCGFCHTSTWISPGCTCVPPFWTPLLPPSHPIPLGCPRAPALSALLHVLKLHGSSILHRVIHIFQCYSLISPHPRGMWILNHRTTRKVPIFKFLFLTFKCKMPERLRLCLI